jgi:acyl-CoA thioester hydrolase
MTDTATTPPTTGEGARFRYDTRVHFDDLDPVGIMHNSRFVLLAERAVAAFFESNGFFWEAAIEDNPDKFHVVRQLHLDLERPVSGSGPITVELWLHRFGTTSITYAFSFLGPRDQLYATGTRTVVKLDPTTMRPAEWTARWREAHLTGLGPARTGVTAG